MAEHCGARHPDDPKRVCILPPTYLDHGDAEGFWPNVEAQERERIRKEQNPKGKSKSKRRSSLAGIASAVEQGRRDFNGVTKAEGMEQAETSEASADFRTQFCLLMAEVACGRWDLTTNDVWALWEERGLGKPESKQAAGVAGRMLAKMGVLATTEQMQGNTSGNGHSTDNGVRVWRSRVVGLPVESVQMIVKTEMAKSTEEM